MTHRVHPMEVVVPIALAALGGMILLQTATAFVEAGAASGDALSNSAMFPRLIAWGLILTGAINLARALLRNRPGEQTGASHAPSGRLLGRAGLTCACLAGYLAVLPLLGFPVATFALMTALFALLGARLLEASSLGVIVTVLAILAFEQGLGVIFPVGRLGLF